MNEPIVTVSESELEAVGSALAKSLSFGDIIFLEGELGAGKTTLMDIITGKTRPDAGTVFFGTSICILYTSDAADE